jgi:hypothetical protein
MAGAALYFAHFSAQADIADDPYFALGIAAVSGSRDV